MSVVAGAPCSCTCHRPGMKVAHAVPCCANSGRTWDGGWVDRLDPALRQRVQDAIPKEQQRIIEEQHGELVKLRKALELAAPYVAKLAADIPEGMVAQKQTMGRVLDRINEALS